MTAIAALLIGSIVSAIVGAGTSAINNGINVANQNRINAENVQAQKDINAENIAYSKEYAQNQMQWRVQDLEAAGLNPVLAAGQNVSMSAPSLQAPQQKAPVVDFSGISSAITAMNNTMLTAYLTSQRNDIQAERNDVLRDLYKRKAEFFDSGRGDRYVSTAKQLSKAANELADGKGEDWEKQWQEILKWTGKKRAFKK